MIGYLLKTLGGLLHILLNVVILIFIVRAVLSWVQPDARQPIIRFIYTVTDPVLSRIHRLLPPMGGIDFSPLVAILLCWVLDSFVAASLIDLGYRLIH
ncbi:MAG: YggT family protein [bacterium]